VKSEHRTQVTEEHVMLCHRCLEVAQVWGGAFVCVNAKCDRVGVLMADPRDIGLEP